MIFRSILLLCATLTLAACSDQQQDDLFSKVIELGRDQAGLVKKQQPALDIEMTYLERLPEGAVKGPTLVLLHGFSANKDNWLRFVMALDEKYHVIVPDLAGHGDNKRDLAGDYDLFKQAERLHALMQAKGINKFHIAGNSMGGAVSAIYGLEYPQDLASLTLLDAAGIDGKNKSEYFSALEQGTNPLIPTDDESFDFLLNFTMSQPPFLPWPLKPAFQRISISRNEINKEIFSDMMTTRDRLDNNGFQQQLISAASASPIPTLIIWGEEDRVLDVSAVPEFQKVLPHAEVKIFPGVGHLPMVEIPDESAEFYSAFVERAEQQNAETAKQAAAEPAVEVAAEHALEAEPVADTAVAPTVSAE